jgi:hypothetical protein
VSGRDHAPARAPKKPDADDQVERGDGSERARSRDLRTRMGEQGSIACVIKKVG